MGDFSIAARVGFLQDGSPAENEPNDVKVVQFLLNAIPASEGAPSSLLDVDGVLGQATSDAIGAFQQHQLGFTDHLVEPFKNTIKRMNATQTVAPPGFPAASEELNSWATRRTPAWNFTRGHMLANGTLTFSPDSQALLPAVYQANLSAAFAAVLDPTVMFGGAWGVSSFDFYHCHVAVPMASATTADHDLASRRLSFENQMEQLRRQAAGGGGVTARIATAAQAEQFRQLLRGLTPGYRRLLEDAAARPGVRMEYHTFEGTPPDRPATMTPNDQRRHWGSAALVANPSVGPSIFGVTQSLTASHILVGGLGFLIDQERVVHVVPGSLLELSAPTGLPEDDLQ